jgi:dTDP-glucose 4,6-dehydratase
MDSTILVTGGAGFIGGNFVHRQYHHTDRTIVNLDLLTYAGNRATLAAMADGSRHIFVQGDIGDRQLVSQLLQQHRPGAIVNFAAETHVDRSIDGPAAFIQTNVTGTFELLEATRSYWKNLSSPERESFRFVHVSTDEVFGSLGPSDPPFSETTPYAPNSPYSASKAASDHLVRAYHHTYGLPTLITNCSNNYGPYQFPEKLIPLTILNALARKPLPIYGDGQNIRDWLYVGDHCLAIELVLAQGQVGATYNVGGNAERTNLWLVEQICTLLDELSPMADGASYRQLITFVPDRPGHDRRYAIDGRKLHQELGWQPQVEVFQGLRQTVQWYIDHQDWCQQVTANKYQQERLGVSV